LYLYCGLSTISYGVGIGYLLLIIDNKDLYFSVTHKILLKIRDNR